VEQGICDVCPRRCELAEGAWGFCDVRAAHHGSIRDMYYTAVAWPGIRVQFGIDVPYAFSPSRKKLLAEVYLPGCNLKCDFCVGPHLSELGDIRGIQWVQPADLVANVAGLADGLIFTGGEPTIHPEYLKEVFSKCRDRRMFTGFESNGYMTRSTAEKLASVTDFIAIGLKASLDKEFYKRKFGVETQPILEAAAFFAESGCDVLLTDLTDPNLWDDKQAFVALTEWIARNLGSDTRLVLSPMETTDRTPVTPQEQRKPYLEGYRKLAMDAGLTRVFFQVDIRQRSQEWREHLDKIGLYRAMDRLRMRVPE
jgi:pyruvate formate lyase activating enzyme